MVIALESSDGAGKSTQVELLRAEGYSTFKSPNYDSDLGNLIKNRLFSWEYDKDVMALLFLADLLEAQKQYSKYKDEIIILDRSFISTVVCQEIDFDLCLKLGLKIPDLVLYLECDDSLSRIKNKDILENEEFQKKVKYNYNKLFEERDIDFARIDANKSIEEVHKNIMLFVHSLRS